MDEVDEQGRREVTVDWGDAIDAATIFVNQFVAQVGVPRADGTPDGVYVVFGSVVPPILLGDEESRRRQIEAIKGVRVSVHGRFQMSRGRLDELINVLQTTAENYDAAVEAARRANTDEEGEHD